MTPNRRRMLIAGGLVLALAVGGGAAAYLISTDSRAKEAGKSKGPPAVPVTVAAVTKETVAVRLAAIGNVEAYSTVALKARVDGQITEVNFKADPHQRRDRLGRRESKPGRARASAA